MFRLVNGGERLPQRATRFSAGFDIFAREDTEIGAGKMKLIGLGIALDADTLETIQFIHEQNGVGDFMSSHYFDLCMRSSLALKGLIIPNGAGKIDMDYPDELKMMVHNPVQLWDTGNGSVDINCFTPYRVKCGDKIGQLILCRHEGYLLPAEYTLDAERMGGFGSTGE